MSKERWERTKQILEEALRLAPERRQSYLDLACGPDGELRAEVESLIASHEDAGSQFLAAAAPDILDLASSTILSPFRLNEIIGQYRLVEEIGRGGMGIVYRARDAQLGRDVAIKVLPSSLSRDNDRLRLFEKEARAAGALNHPNILAVHYFGIHEGAPYLVSELLEGSTLRNQLHRGPLATRKAVDYGIQIAHGLAAAHEKGVVHRDLKPENLFVAKDGRIKILDFGLAKLTEKTRVWGPSMPTLSQGTAPGVVMGTVGYMSPEQVCGQETDERTDLFTFGAILYEMLTGTRAFHKPTSAETMNAIVNEEPPPISQSLPGIPPALQRVLQRCLEKRPEQRFHSASDLAFALEALSDSGSSPTTVLALGKSRSSWLWITAVGFAVATFVALALWFTRSPAVPVVEAVTQLTDDGEPKFGTLATDGARIYVNEGPSGSLRIAQVSVSGGETTQLSTQLVNPQIADITKDFSALVVLVGTSSPKASVWSLSLPAGTARRLGNLEASDASLLPDGRIVYGFGSAIYVAQRDGSNPRKLAELPQLNIISGLAVSPAGDRIVFSTFLSNSGGWAPLYEMASDGTSLRELLRAGQGDLPSEICCAQWTPDSRYLLFEGRNQGRWDLWVLPEDAPLLQRSRTPVRLTNGPLSYLPAAAFSRDGKMFSVGAKRRGELVRYDSKGQEFVPYLGGISAFDTTFSRDGKWVAYVAYPEHTLWRGRADGTDRLQLTYPPQLVLSPRISPDGTRVAFSTRENDSYVISMNGGTPQKIGDNAQAPSWSPDGNMVVAYSFTPGKQFGERGYIESKMVDLPSGKVSIVPDSQGTGGPWFAAQDTLVAATEDSKKLVLFDLKTSKWSELATSPDEFQAWQPSPDGKYLYCTTGGADPKALRIRIADHAAEAIVSLKNLRSVDDPYESTKIGVAPDGSALFTRDVGTQEVYALTVKWP
jgi:serine/threonine protein kinase